MFKGNAERARDRKRGGEVKRGMRLVKEETERYRSFFEMENRVKMILGRIQASRLESFLVHQENGKRMRKIVHQLPQEVCSENQ